MNPDEFLIRDWNDLCSRVRRTAQHHSEKNPEEQERYSQPCEKFCEAAPPESYSEMLQRYAAARDIAISWLPTEPAQDSISK
jgi:hypothetical protein